MTHPRRMRATFGAALHEREIDRTRHLVVYRKSGVRKHIEAFVAAVNKAALARSRRRP